MIEISAVSYCAQSPGLGPLNPLKFARRRGESLQDGQVTQVGGLGVVCEPVNRPHPVYIADYTFPSLPPDQQRFDGGLEEIGVETPAAAAMPVATSTCLRFTPGRPMRHG